ncbi:universal stress protein [Streptomyces sp. 7N604]|uniref:universal stress protein n=1 Tax=Streptomyces sp. 7N604 TaxID=3457415 RepID=UPI003FD1A3E2
MSRTVTAGLDGSRESLAAAAWAAREARRRGLPLRLVHAWEAQPYVTDPLVGPIAQRHWSERIPREAVAALRQQYPGVEITADQIAGETAAVLSAAAEDAELLVLGSRGLSGVAGFLVGSVALATVARARGPVVLVRAGEVAEDEHQPDSQGLPSTTTPYRDVVLGLDLTRPCDEVIEFAFDAAARRAAVLRVVHGWSLPPIHGYGPEAIAPEPDDDFGARQDRALSDALRPWRAKFPGVEVIEQAMIGRPAHHLVDASADAGVMVVGRRNRRSPVGTHIGPVTHAVLHRSSAPVAVVPHD